MKALDQEKDLRAKAERQNVLLMKALLGVLAHVGAIRQDGASTEEVLLAADRFVNSTDLERARSFVDHPGASRDEMIEKLVAMLEEARREGPV